MHYMIGLQENWVDLKNANIVEVQIKKDMNGQILAKNIKECCLIGSDFVSHVIISMMKQGKRHGLKDDPIAQHNDA